MLDQYTVPKGYSIGDCNDKYLKINNEYDNMLKQTWTFSLNSEKPKARSTKRKKNA